MKSQTGSAGRCLIVHNDIILSPFEISSGENRSMNNFVRVVHSFVSASESVRAQVAETGLLMDRRKAALRPSSERPLSVTKCSRYLKKSTAFESDVPANVVVGRLSIDGNADFKMDVEDVSFSLSVELLFSKWTSKMLRLRLI